MRRLFVFAAAVAWTAAAVAQQERGMGSSQQERSMGMQQHGMMSGDTNKHTMTSEQIADMFRNTKHSLSDSISGKWAQGCTDHAMPSSNKCALSDR